MGLLRCRRDEAVSRRFRMREKLIAVGDDYWIENDVGDKVFKVNGMAARVRDRWVLENASGVEAGRIKERKPTFRDSFKIDVDGGEAHVTKALAGIRGRFHIEVAAATTSRPTATMWAGPSRAGRWGTVRSTWRCCSRRIRRSTAKGWSSWSTTGGLSRPRT